MRLKVCSFSERSKNERYFVTWTPWVGGGGGTLENNTISTVYKKGAM
jgi:hypothetical protein